MIHNPFGGDDWADLEGGAEAEAGGIHDVVAGLLPAPAGGREGAKAILQALAEELRIRFAHEEQLMRARGYPRFLEHAAAHAAFLSELAAARAALERSGLTPQLARWFAAGCGAWLRAHARTHDRALGQHLHRIAWARALRRAALPAALAAGRERAGARAALPAVASFRQAG